MKKRMTICAAFLAATLGLSAQKTMKAPAGGKAISDELIGIFFEDISSSADGGLYAELIQNGSFEYSPSERDGWGPGTAWKVIRPGHSLGRLDARMDNACAKSGRRPCPLKVFCGISDTMSTSRSPVLSTRIWREAF